MFSIYKLRKEDCIELQSLLYEYVYTSGFKLNELQLNDKFKYVEIQDHACGDPTEKLCYSAKFQPICV